MMKVKVRKKPVGTEHALKVKVQYFGIDILGKRYTFGMLKDIWKYVGSTVTVIGNSVFSTAGNFLGFLSEIKHSYSYEDIRSYIAEEFEKYRKKHPSETNRFSTPAAIIEAEKKCYASFIWELMDELMAQDIKKHTL